MRTAATLALIFIYSGLGAYVWGFWQNRPNDTYPIGRELLLLTPALLLHAVLVWQPLINGNMVIFGFAHALNLVIWLMMLLYFAGSLRYPLKGLQIMLYPLAVLCLIITLLLPGNPAGYSRSVGNIPFLLHIAASVLAYCLFGIATLLAVLIILAERDLHRRRMSPLVRFLPPLLSLEKLMFQAIWIGFVLLTISVVSGTFFAEVVFGVNFSWSHKTVFGIASWLIYAILLYLRITHAWRGKKLALWIIIGFLSLMLAYIGSKFVLEIILNRPAILHY